MNATKVAEIFKEDIKMDDFKKIEDLKNDKEFLEKISKTTDANELAKAFSDVGVNITPEQMEEAQKVAKEMEAKSDELVEEDLDKVSGGFAVSGTAAFIIKIGGVLFLAWAGGKILQSLGY